MAKKAEPETNLEVADEVVKSGFKKVRVKDFRGSFADAIFDDNCEAEINDETFEILKKHFPDAEVTEI